MAILKSPPKPPKNETLQIRVEESIRSKLAKYAEFIDSSESYVVSEALKLVFRKDDEFKSRLEDTKHNGNQTQNDGGSLFEIAKKARRPLIYNSTCARIQRLHDSMPRAFQ